MQGLYQILPFPATNSVPVFQVAVLSILFLDKKDSLSNTVFTTKYNKWQTVARPFLFNNISFVNSTKLIIDGSFPKLSSDLESSILYKINNETKNLENFSQKAGKGIIYYTRKLSGFVQILDFIPAIFDASGSKRNPSELKDIKFDSEIISSIFLGLLNSNLFFGG